MLGFLFVILVFWLLYLVFAQQIKRWMIRRAGEHIARNFGQNPFNQQNTTNNPKTKPEADNKPADQKIDVDTLAKRKFDKGQGEYVEFEDIDTKED